MNRMRIARTAAVCSRSTSAVSAQLDTHPRATDGPPIIPRENEEGGVDDQKLGAARVLDARPLATLPLRSPCMFTTTLSRPSVNPAPATPDALWAVTRKI